MIGLSNAIKNEVSHALKMKRNYEKRNSECKVMVDNKLFRIKSVDITLLSSIKEANLCSSFKSVLNKVPTMA